MLLLVDLLIIGPLSLQCTLNVTFCTGGMKESVMVNANVFIGKNPPACTERNAQES